MTASVMVSMAPDREEATNEAVPGGIQHSEVRQLRPAAVGGAVTGSVNNVLVRFPGALRCKSLFLDT
jgi:hypothetical protein